MKTKRTKFFKLLQSLIQYKLVALCLLTFLTTSCENNSNQKTEFAAYTLSQHTRFKVNDRTDEYFDWMNYNFGISESETSDILDYVKPIRNMDYLELRTITLLTKLVEKEMLDYSNDEFMSDILTPFLWIILTEKEEELESNIKPAIVSEFERRFGILNNSNGLSALLSTYNSYMNGGYYENDSIGIFNESVRNHGYYLKFDTSPRYLCIFSNDKKLSDETIEEKYGFSILLLKRKIPCALPRQDGYSTNGATDVVVFEDKLTNQAVDIVAKIKNDSLETRYKGKHIKFWRKIGLRMGPVRGNNILKLLIEKDFKNRDQESIKKDLVLSVAIHEAKHKYDEKQTYIRINWDNEVSAHLTQIIFSNSPYHSLMQAIKRFEGFTIISYDPKMKTITKQLWDIAIRVEKGTISKDELVKESKDIYLNYRTYDDEPLPDLDVFNSDIVSVLMNSN